MREFSFEPAQPPPSTTTTTTNTPASTSTTAPSTAGTATGTTEMKRLKVLVAIDDSDWSFYALKWVLDNILACSAGATENAGEVHIYNTIVLLHVQAPFQHYVYPAGPAIIPPIYPTRDIADSVRKVRQEHAAIVLARAIDMCNGWKVRVDSIILEGDPKEMICEAVDRIHCDLLVVGSRGLGKIKRAFLGSVSDYCAHHANCPVLIVKPPK